MDRYKVLFVDDEPNVLRSLTRLFHIEYFDVLNASSGDQALGIIRAAKVQLVVTDNIMPEMSGVELIRKIKEVSPDTIRIILSGQSEMQDVLKAVNDGGAFRFILKPWVDADLKANVYIALAHYKLQQDCADLKRQLAEKDRLLNYVRRQFPDLFTAVPPELYHEIKPEPASSESPKNLVVE